MCFTVSNKLFLKSACIIAFVFLTTAAPAGANVEDEGGFDSGRAWIWDGGAEAKIKYTVKAWEVLSGPKPCPNKTEIVFDSTKPIPVDIYLGKLLGNVRFYYTFSPKAVLTNRGSQVNNRNRAGGDFDGPTPVSSFAASIGDLFSEADIPVIDLDGSFTARSYSDGSFLLRVKTQYGDLAGNAVDLLIDDEGYASLTWWTSSENEDGELEWEDKVRIPGGKVTQPKGRIGDWSAKFEKTGAAEKYWVNQNGDEVDKDDPAEKTECVKVGKYLITLQVASEDQEIR